MAGNPRIEEYRNALLHAESVFNTEVRKNKCPEINVREYYCYTFLGKGAMGNVYKVEKDGFLFAMKQLTKQKYRDNLTQEAAAREKRYWWAMSNPFIVDLLFKAKDRVNLYMIMEYTPHSDLNRMLTRGPVPEDKCRKLLCQVVMALEYLHACNVVYRDMKPQNVLVFPRGRLKVADFGLCLKQTESTNRFGGTCAYMSPEMINKQLYNHTTDWWSFGVMMFQLLLDRHPFGTFEEPRPDVIRHILVRPIQGLDEADMSGDAKDLLEKLLNKSFKARITSGTEGVDEVKEHPWFKSIDFDQLIVQEDFVQLDPEDNYSTKEQMVSDDLFHYTGKDSDDPYNQEFADF